MSRVPSVPRCSAGNIACRRTSCATASAIQSRPEPFVAVLVFGLLIGTAGSTAPSLSAQEDQPSLAEAARQNRARVAASRERHGPAPRFTDADLAGARPRRQSPPTAPLETPALREPPVTAEDLPAGDPGEDTADPGADEVEAAIAARLRVIAEREAEIRERLLDVEASLTAIGSSGLPTAPRNPNRFQSPLDTNSLRAEQEELNRELDALAAERRILR